MHTNTQQNYFFSQPHQPFFLLAVINAIVMMLLFALSYKGIVTSSIDVTMLHSYSLIFLVFYNAFSGFLFTTFPRFNQTPVIEKHYYTTLFFANALASTLFIAGVLTSSLGIALAMVIGFVSQLFGFKKLYHIYTTGHAVDKTDSFWILTASAFGLAGNILFFLSLF